MYKELMNHAPFMQHFTAANDPFERWHLIWSVQLVPPDARSDKRLSAD
jgi:hypothetical protein